MNIGVTGGLTGSAAGAPLSQTAGAETERSQKDSAVRERLADSQNKSEKASGIGTTEQDQQTDERDADGRRLFEGPGKRKRPQANAEAAADEPDRRAKDPSGLSGNALDLTG
jgi:hypothetical protein